VRDAGGIIPPAGAAELAGGASWDGWSLRLTLPTLRRHARLKGGFLMSPTSARQGQAKPSLVGPNLSAALEWLWQHLRDERHPHVLDCGPVRQATINVLLRRGAKLYLADIVTAVQQGDASFWTYSRKARVFRPEVLLSQFPEIPPDSLSAVFSWHLLDLLPRDALPPVVNRFFSYLHVGGVLVCLLREPYLPKGAETTWRLESINSLAAEGEGNRPFPYPALTNREVERLVPLGNVKTFLTRSGRREVLAVK